MKQEAKFSVILPAGNYSAAQIETFEQTAQKYGLPVSLPLRSDRSGNIIVAPGMTLREAQMLRRQVSGCGFPADVVSDAEQARNALQVNEPVSMDTVVVEFDDVPSFDHMDPIADMTSDAWSSLEMPSSLDLGLSDGADLDENHDWKGEAWLAPEPSAKSLSISAADILKKAKAVEQDSTDAKRPKDDDFNDNMIQEINSEFDMLAIELVDEAEKPVITDAVTMEVAAPQLELLEEAAAKHEAACAKQTPKTASKPISDIPQPQTETPNLEVLKTEPLSEVTTAQNEDIICASQTPKYVMLVTCLLIGLCLILSFVCAFVTPVSGLEFLFSPLF